MTIRVKVPAQLRSAVSGLSELEVDSADDLRGLISTLGTSHPDLVERILDESGEIRRFVNIYVGDEDVRFLDGLATPLTPGEVVSILPAVAGGL